MKWDSVEKDVLPLWVADMDFAVAPCIQRAVQQRAAHPVYGYTDVPKSYFDAVVRWYERRHQWTIDPSWVVYTQGVVPAISCSLRALTLPGERVLVMTPAYNCFFSSVANQGCQMVEHSLKREGKTYRIDFAQLEKQCSDPKVTVLLLCNPHNPTGRVWTPEELRQVAAICERQHVTVVSDEIHCELTMPGHKFTPFASVSSWALQHTVTLSSPSKSFNTAGLQIANIICADEEMRRRIDRVVNIFEVCDVNPFGPVALQAAYNEGEPWLKELCQQVWSNYEWLSHFLKKELPTVQVMEMEGTYLAWVDISQLPLTSDKAAELLEREARVKLSAGTLYGTKDGEGFLRINLACTPATLQEAMQRVARALKNYDTTA